MQEGVPMFSRSYKSYLLTGQVNTGKSGPVWLRIWQDISRNIGEYYTQSDHLAIIFDLKETALSKMTRMSTWSAKAIEIQIFIDVCLDHDTMPTTPLERVFNITTAWVELTRRWNSMLRRMLEATWSKLYSEAKGATSNNSAQKVSKEELEVFRRLGDNKAPGLDHTKPLSWLLSKDQTYL